MTAELCTELPFDFLIGRGDSWLSSLHEAALSFLRAEHANVAVGPYRHKDAVAGLGQALVQPRARQHAEVMEPAKGLWPKSRSAIEQSFKGNSYVFVRTRRGPVLF